MVEATKDIQPVLEVLDQTNHDHFRKPCCYWRDWDGANLKNNAGTLSGITWGVVSVARARWRLASSLDAAVRASYPEFMTFREWWAYVRADKIGIVGILLVAAALVAGILWPQARRPRADLPAIAMDIPASARMGTPGRAANYPLR